MDSIVGADLIVAALVFGLSAITFATAPFLLVMIGGIRKAETTNSGEGGYITTLFMAFCVHIISCMFFMALIHILDIFYDQSKYISNTVLKIFWNSGDSFKNFNFIQASGDAAHGAWTVLKMATTTINLIFALLPLLLIAGAASYGFKQARKDTYNENILTIITFISVSVIMTTIFYIAWASIAGLALFMPNDSSLIGYTRNLWIEHILKTGS
ncbi:MAG: hypothetical protein LBG67_02175 [Campylobacteraceae bacterium]|nr:hypothetical protein [Campylobacteraceae bacterium]